MKRCRRLVVAVHLSDEDTTTLRYAGMLARVARPEVIDVVHVWGTRGVPADFLREHRALTDEALADARARLAQRVQECLDVPDGVRVNTRLQWGSPMPELLRVIHELDADLVITGRDPDKSWAGTVPERLARRAPCSVLVVPRGAAARVGNLLVPVDFSESAAAALDTALELGALVGAEAIHCVHAYRLPQGYSKLGKTEEQFGRSLKKIAEGEWQEFIAALDRRGLDLSCEFVLEEHPTRAIFNAVENRDTQLIVVGSGGRSAGAGLLTGSTALRLINATRVPLWVVKEPSRRRGLRELLRRVLGEES